MIRFLTLSILSLLVLGCGGKNASHLPSILELPGAIIGSGVENALYKAKRKKVSAYVASNLEALRRADEPTISKALSIAKVPQKNHPFINLELKNPKSTTLNPVIMITEMATTRYASLYTISKRDKKINGFRYDEVYKTIFAHVEANPQAFYEALKSGDGGKSLAIMMDKLRIKEPALREKFSSHLLKNFRQLYVEPIVLLLMVNS